MTLRPTLLATAWLVALPALAAPVDIPLQSPSFTPGGDGRVVGWQPHQHAGSPSYQFAIEREHPRTAPGAARITRTGPEPFGMLAQDIAVLPAWQGKTVRVTAWLKTRDVAGEGVALVLQVQGGGGAILANAQMDGKRRKGTADWQAGTETVKIPPGAMLLRVAFMLEGDGTVWADDFKLELLD